MRLWIRNTRQSSSFGHLTDGTNKAIAPSPQERRLLPFHQSLRARSPPALSGKDGTRRVTDVRLFGQIDSWPSKGEMARLLKASGLSVVVGRYSIRVADCEHFTFQEYGGDLGEPVLDADASTLEQMLTDGSRVSAALARADIRHRFGLYNESDELVGYIHHRWPQPSE